MKRILAAIFACTLALTAWVQPVFADDDGWNGDSGYGDRDDRDRDGRNITLYEDCPVRAELPAQQPEKPDATQPVSSVVRLTNARRQDAGLSALAVDEELQRAAKVRAAEIAVSFSHTRPDGSAWNTVSTAVNGENIAMGYQDAQAVVGGWMDSPGHKDNILHTQYTRIGTACVQVDGALYWVQLFGI